MSKNRLWKDPVLGPLSMLPLAFVLDFLGLRFLIGYSTADSLLRAALFAGTLSISLSLTGLISKLWRKKPKPTETSRG